jgi:hypothetical protein
VDALGDGLLRRGQRYGLYLALWMARPKPTQRTAATWMRKDPGRGPQEVPGAVSPGPAPCGGGVPTRGPRRFSASPAKAFRVWSEKATEGFGQRLPAMMSDPEQAMQAATEIAIAWWRLWGLMPVPSDRVTCMGKSAEHIPAQPWPAPSASANLTSIDRRLSHLPLKTGQPVLP